MGYYNLEDIKAIPLEAILNDYGIDVKKGKFALRDERTPSAKIYPETNTWADFGGGDARGGTTVNLVMQKEGLSWEEAVQALGARYNVPTSENDRGENRKALTNAQYSKIGLVGTPAYRNSVKLEYADVLTQPQIDEIIRKYDMPMNQLFSEDKAKYEEILRNEALPYLKDSQQSYYRQLDILDATNRELDANATERYLAEICAKSAYDIHSEAYNIFERAAQGTDLKVTRFKPDFDRDLAGIGNISIEIGDFSYSDLKSMPGKNYHITIPESQYREFDSLVSTGQLEISAPYSVFKKGQDFTVSYKSEEDARFKGIFNSIKGMAHEQAQKEASPRVFYSPEFE